MTDDEGGPVMPQPQPQVWPVCVECGTDFALRRNLLDGEWLWTRDCKHKKADHRFEGPLASKSLPKRR